MLVNFAANIGSKKPARQSSEGWGGNPNRGVDGNANPQWGGATCTHTQSQAQAWWSVDLGKSSTITKIEVVNRVDCCGKFPIQQ